MIEFFLAGIMTAQMTLTTEAPARIRVAQSVGDPTQRQLEWTPGQCGPPFRIYRYDGKRWGFWGQSDETPTEPRSEAVLKKLVPVENKQRAWTVSAVCGDGREWFIAGGFVLVDPGPWEAANP